MALTYEPIATQTLGSNQTSITFSSISGAYTDLRLMLFGPVQGDVYIRFNSDTGTSYSQTVLGVNSSNIGSALSGRQTNTSTIYSDFYGGFANAYPTQISWDIMNYSNSTTFKTVLARAGIVSTQPSINQAAMLWRSTSAINAISLAGGTFSTGLVVTLYGIKAA